VKPHTPRQREVLVFVEQFIAEHAYPPTLREMGVGLGIASTNAVTDHLLSLERQGYIRREPTKARSIRVLRPSSEWNPPAAAAPEVETSS